MEKRDLFFRYRWGLFSLFSFLLLVFGIFIENLSFYKNGAAQLGVMNFFVVSEASQTGSMPILPLVVMGVLAIGIIVVLNSMQKGN